MNSANALEPRPVIIVANLDTLKRKNLYQAEALPDFEFAYFSYKGGETPEGRASWIYPRSLARRVMFVWRLFRQYRSRAHHVELYTGNGSFFLLEFIAARLLRIKVVVAERGTPLLGFSSQSWLKRVALKLAYSQADAVWVRERWMPAALSAVASRSAFFLHNAVGLLNGVEGRGDLEDRQLEFLWVNSFKPWRNPEWLCTALRDERLADCRAVMLGVLDAAPGEVTSAQVRAREAAGPNVEFIGFVDPSDWYRRARFFVLPADIVYLNFSLLEAMASGVVPIIPNVDGADEIVEDGHDGLIYPHSLEGLREALVRATALTPDEWKGMSENAVAKIGAKFSLEAWRRRILSLYESVGA